MIRRLSENTASRAGYRLGGLAERFDQECVGTARWYRRVAKPSNCHEAKLIGTHKRPIWWSRGRFQLASRRCPPRERLATSTSSQRNTSGRAGRKRLGPVVTMRSRSLAHDAAAERDIGLP